MTDELKPCPFCGHTPDPENYIDSIHPITRDGHVWEAGCLANEGGCDAFILGDSREDVIKRWNTRAKDVQKAINDEKQNPWKAAIIQELIVDNILTEELERDPRKALAVAIDWNCKVALDPSVSKEAMELQQQAIDAALEGVADLLDSGDDWNTGDEIAEFIRSRIGTNPLAERDTRIAELERELAEARKDAERWRFAKHRFTRAASVDMSGRHTYTFIGRTIGRGLNVDEAIDAAMLAEREKE